MVVMVVIRSSGGDTGMVVRCVGVSVGRGQAQQGQRHASRFRPKEEPCRGGVGQIESADGRARLFVRKRAAAQMTAAVGDECNWYVKMMDRSKKNVKARSDNGPFAELAEQTDRQIDRHRRKKPGYLEAGTTMMRGEGWKGKGAVQWERGGRKKKGEKKKRRARRLVVVSVWELSCLWWTRGFEVWGRKMWRGEVGGGGKDGDFG